MLSLRKCVRTDEERYGRRARTRGAGRATRDNVRFHRERIGELTSWSEGMPPLQDVSCSSIANQRWAGGATGETGNARRALPSARLPARPGYSQKGAR